MTQLKLMILLVCSISFSACDFTCKNQGVPQCHCDCTNDYTGGHCELQKMDLEGQTGWGEWGEIEKCEEGSFAVGASIKAEKWQHGDDDTAVNAVQLKCRSKKDNKITKYITSTQGYFGSWLDFQDCGSGFITAASLKSVPYHNHSDDTGVTNILFKCNHGDEEIGKWDNGKATEWGDWSGLKSCDSNKAVCGIRTKVEPPQGSHDDTALNNVVLYCCDLD